MGYSFVVQAVNILCDELLDHRGVLQSSEGEVRRVRLCIPHGRVAEV